MDMEAIAALAGQQGGVLHRRQLRSLGADRWRVRNQVTAGRWSTRGRHTVATTNGVIGALGERWTAVFECGAGAAIDGVTALVHAGLTGFDAGRRPTVSLPGHYHRPEVPQVDIRGIASRCAGEVLEGLPRVRPDVALIRAAEWAASDRQAALLLVMTAQQRLVRVEELPALVAEMKPHWRRAFIATVVGDVARGVQALGELDFARLCERYRIPPPSLQVVRELPGGRAVRDAHWDNGLGVEIDGVQHHLGLGPVDDALRLNALLIGGDSTLRLPVLGLRLHEAELMAQVREAYWLFERRATRAG